MEIRQECWHTKKTEKLKMIRMLFVILYCLLQEKCMDEFLPQCILFLQKMIMNKATRSIWYENRQI